MFGQMPLGKLPSNPNRTFVFDHEVNLTSHSLEFQIDNNSENVNLRPVMHAFQVQRGYKDQYMYRVFDPTISQYVELPESQELPQHFFMTPIILLKYRKATAESDTESSSSVVSNDSRKERNKERTVRQVIESVKRWRDIHGAPGRDKNRVSLQEAAKIVGISKKSLDDYYYQLRIGEQNHFDFEAHMDSKIGVLRAFVRKHKPTKQSVLSQRHTRQLKIIEALGIEQISRPEPMIVEADPQPSPATQMINENSAEEKPIPYLDFNEQKVYDESELRYYDNFLLDSAPEDPFVPYREMDFKKKQQDFQDEFDMPW